MKTRHLLLTAFVMVASAVSTTIQAQQMPPIPVDQAVKTGKLANGLTYYIRKNAYPEHRVNFYIAQRVGSIQEDENQRGLAHFLEHMAFNGSDHFKGDRMIEYLRSIGVEFGADLNAYTAVDKTVYRICNVPSARVETLDSCLLVLKDWAHGLTLDAGEIDKERGVIHEEWRQSTSPMSRMLERNLEKLYPGSKYGRRMPIGLMSVVDNFKPEVLRAYYHKWYRPDNQAIIVVGDVDVNRTEARIKDLFSGIKLQPNAAKVVDEPVPDNDKAIILIDKDKEQPVDLIQLFFKHDVTPDSLKNNMDYLVKQYVIKLAAKMLNARLLEKGENPECPYVHAVCADGEYIYSNTKDAFSCQIVPKAGKSVDALKAMVREVMRVVKFGFTPTEYERAKSDYMAELEKTFTNKDKRDNNVFGDIYTDNYIDNEPMPSINDEYAIMQQVTPMLPVDVVNQTMKRLVSQTDTNLVVFAVYNEKNGNVYPTSEQLKTAIDGVHTEQLKPYVDNVKNEPLVATLPKKGKIVGNKVNARLGYKELMLSNGARVFLKKTDFKNDEIVFEAVSKGGKSLLGKGDVMNGKLFDDVIAYSGLGNFSMTELKKALAGKQTSANMLLKNRHEIVNAKSTPKDMETMFQLIYLYFTDIRKDEKSFASLMNLAETALKNKSLSPDMAFEDSLNMTLYRHNPVFSSIEPEDLKKVNYDRILQIAKERFSNVADFTFTIVGNYDEAILLPFIEQYIASLPASGKKEEAKPIYTYSKGTVENRFTRKMETPKAMACFYWYDLKTHYSLENNLLAEAAGMVLDMIYLKKIREDAGAAYSTGANGGAELENGTPFNYIMGYCPMKPEQSELALKIMNEEMMNLGKTINADMLDKAKKLLLKRADENARKNDYWVSVIERNEEYGVDLMTDYKQLVNSLTPEKVSKFVKDIILKGGNSVKVVMLPQ